MAERSDLVLGLKAEQGDVLRVLDKMAASLEKLEKRLDGVGDEADNARKKVKTFGEKAEVALAKVGKVAKVAAAAGIAAFTATMYKAVGAASSLETKLAEVSTLLGGKAVQQMEKYEKAIRNMATRTSSSVDELSVGLYQVISAGTKGTETIAGSMNLLEAAQKVAVAGVSDTFSAVDVLTTALNAYGKTSAEAAGFSDVLFTTVKLGKINFQQLSSSIGMVTSSAAGAGVSFEEVNAAIAAMTALGVPAERAITGMNGIIRVASKGTKELDAAIKKKLGTTTSDILETKGLTGVLEALQKVTGGSTIAMQKLGIEQEAIQGLSVLAGTGIDKFKTSLDEMSNSAGATDEAYKKMSATFEQQKQKFWNVIQELLISLGEEVLPDLISAMEKFGNWIMEHKEEIVRAFGGIRAAVGAIVDLIMDGVRGLRLFLYWLGVVNEKYGGKKVATFGKTVVSEVPFPERPTGGAGPGGKPKGKGPRGKGLKLLPEEIRGEGTPFGAGFMAAGVVDALTRAGRSAGIALVDAITEKRAQLLKFADDFAAKSVDSWYQKIGGAELETIEERRAYAFAESLARKESEPGFWSEVAVGFARAVGEKLVNVAMQMGEALLKPFDQIMGLFDLAMGGANVEDVKAYTEQAIALWEALAENLGPVLDYLIDEGIPAIIDAFVEHIPDIMATVAEAVPKLIDVIIAHIPEIIWALVEGIGRAIVELGKGLLKSLIPGKKKKEAGKKHEGGVLPAVFHRGGLVPALAGFANSAGVFSNAMKAHSGMFVRPPFGLARDDVPIIAQAGEGIIRRSMVNAMGGAPAINAINSGKMPGGDTHYHMHTEHLYSKDSSEVIDEMQAENVRRGRGKMRRIISGGDVPGFKPRRQ